MRVIIILEVYKLPELWKEPRLFKNKKASLNDENFLYIS